MNPVTSPKYCDECGSMCTSGGVCPRCSKETVNLKQEIVVRVKREAIIDSARKMLGVPFKHQGRDTRGIDCVGLMFHIAGDTGLIKNLDLPDYWFHMNYSRLPETHGPDANWLLRELSNTFPRTRVRDVKCGDMVYCRNERWVHLGVVTPDRMIHAYAGNLRKVVEHDYDRKWKKATVAAFSWVGAE